MTCVQGVGGASAASPGSAVPIVAGKAESRDVPVYLTGLGSAQAFNQVQVNARVDGQMAQIDPRPYQAALDQATAAKARDEAQLANAKLDLDRYTNLAQREFASRQTLDSQRAQVSQLQATIQGDQAQIDNAKVQLSYTTITAPIAGRTGIRLIDEGNMVRAAAATAIVNIAEIRPISVVFALPQEQLGEVAKAMAAGQPKVIAHSRDGSAKLGEGTLTVIDNQIDPTTGTFRVKATFSNTDNALWPGAFVVADLYVTTRHNAITVPEQVIQRGPNGLFVWGIKPDSTVTVRPVKVGLTQDGVAVVTDGLAAGDSVVVDGQYRLQEGVSVEPRPDAAHAS
jgi:multidrug efflux system membrane fusion protein